MRLSRRHKLMTLVMVAFLCMAGYFYIQSNQPAQGEFDYDLPVTGEDVIDYGDKEFTAAEGMTFVTVTIHAKNTSGDAGYDTNPYNWMIGVSGSEYECNHSATYNRPGYVSTYDIVDTATFTIVYEVPSFTGELPFTMRYDGNYRAAYNPNLVI